MTDEGCEVNPALSSGTMPLSVHAPTLVTTFINIPRFDKISLVLETNDRRGV